MADIVEYLHRYLQTLQPQAQSLSKHVGILLGLDLPPLATVGTDKSFNSLVASAESVLGTLVRATVLLKGFVNAKSDRSISRDNNSHQKHGSNNSNQSNIIDRERGLKQTIDHGRPRAGNSQVDRSIGLIPGLNIPDAIRKPYNFGMTPLETEGRPAANKSFHISPKNEVSKELQGMQPIREPVYSRAVNNEPSSRLNPPFERMERSHTFGALLPGRKGGQQEMRPKHLGGSNYSKCANTTFVATGDPSLNSSPSAGETKLGSQVSLSRCASEACNSVRRRVLRRNNQCLQLIRSFKDLLVSTSNPSAQVEC